MFGIVSGGVECGYPAWYATIHTAIPEMEARFGIDATPCHYVGGDWNPSPACRDAPTEPWNGTGKSWADGCGGGPVIEFPTSCGDSPQGASDDVGPIVAVTEPTYGAAFSSEDGTAAVDIVADASDLPAGVVSVALAVNGVVPEGALDLDPPWRWNAVTFPPGIWELSAVATDWAGNETTSSIVVIGVDETPPPAPEPEGSTGDLKPTTGDGQGESSTGPSPTGTTASDESSTGRVSAGDTEALPPTGGEQVAIDDDGGCSCTTSEGGSSGGLLWLLVGLATLRRRRSAAALGLILGLAGCGDDGAPALADPSDELGPTTSGGTTTADPDESSSSSSVESSSGTTASPTSASTGTDPMQTSTGVEACELGTEGCGCDEDLSCGADLRCELDTCIPCPAGTAACHCVPSADDEEEGTCDGELFCVNTLCVPPPPCPFTEDGTCDEPNIGTGACFENSDFFDCCAVEAGVCEEASAGGACPDGSDAFDCCPTPMDGVCEEEAAGGACLDGSDAFDCCATPMNGVCEEEAAGGECPDGSDAFDCCATPMNDVCEEVSAGGVCPDGSDTADCV